MVEESQEAGVTGKINKWQTAARDDFVGENAKRSSATKTVRFCRGRGLRWEGGRIVFSFTGAERGENGCKAEEIQGVCCREKHKMGFSNQIALKEKKKKSHVPKQTPVQGEHKALNPGWGIWQCQSLRHTCCTSHSRCTSTSLRMCAYTLCKPF